MNPLRRFLEDATTAFALLMDNDLHNQALVVAYSAIDTFAWVGVHGREDHAGSDFMEWVSKYMRPEERLGCSAADLWSARCAILHTGTPESNITRRGAAKQLWYLTGDYTSVAIRNGFAKNPAYGTHVQPVRTTVIMLRFLEGAFEFIDEISRDPVRSREVAERASRWLFPRLLVREEGIDSLVSQDLRRARWPAPNLREGQ